MANKIAGDFGSFSTTMSAAKIKDLEKFKTIIDSDPNISDELAKIFKKKGFEVPDIFKPPKIKFPFDLPLVFNPVPTLPPGTIGPGTQSPTVPEHTLFEIDTALQLLLNAIPIADPGNLITSEYHNALRDAVRALASRIGLSVNPAADFKILTFPPEFQPKFIKQEENLKWDVVLNRASTPRIPENNQEQRVSGGMAIQLPDNASIYQMIVRGERELQPKSPKEFVVALNRMKFGKERLSQKLISLDLKDVQQANKQSGYFEEKDGVKLSDGEATLESGSILGAKINDRKTVDNEKWIYYVTADWFGSFTSAVFDIYSIQIICKV